MRPAILSALILAGSATAAFAQTDPRLAEVTMFFAAADIVAGPEGFCRKVCEYGPAYQAVLDAALWNWRMGIRL